jgi:hypothetical protein
MTPPTAITTNTHWLANNNAPLEIDSLCLGTGRFLRSVLLPPLVATQQCHPACIQTRGTNFLEFMALQKEATFPVDTVLYNGSTETVFVKCFGAFSLGTPAHKDAVYQDLIHSPKIMKRYVYLCLCFVLCACACTAHNTVDAHLTSFLLFIYFLRLDATFLVLASRKLALHLPTPK